MTDLRKAAEQALEAMSDAELMLRIEDSRMHEGIRNGLAQACDTLRAALAEPDEVAAAVEAEREACKEICDAVARRAKSLHDVDGEYAASWCKARIEERGKP